MAADGVANEQIARLCMVDPDTVRRWRARFVRNGLAGVGVIAKGRGRRSSLPASTVAEVLRLTQHERPPDGSTHWSTRTLASQVGIGKDAVARIWADHDLKPWKVDMFKTGSDRLCEPMTRNYTDDAEDAALLQRALLRGDVGEIRGLGDIYHRLGINSRSALAARWSA
jgi:transposase